MAPTLRRMDAQVDAPYEAIIPSKKEDYDSCAEFVFHDLRVALQDEDLNVYSKEIQIRPGAPKQWYLCCTSMVATGPAIQNDFEQSYARWMRFNRMQERKAFENRIDDAKRDAPDAVTNDSVEEPGTAASSTTGNVDVRYTIGLVPQKGAAHNSQEEATLRCVSTGDAGDISNTKDDK